MLEPSNNDELPAIPGKRYFTIGEVSELCGNRRYYQRQDVLVIRQIRALLYDQGFTIGGARNRLEGEEAREDVTQTHQLSRQLRVELEEIARILRR
jgi:DNA-binding transcriptional MerR regulator